jgi:hypothetical protein
MSCFRNLFDRSIESLFVGFGGFGKTAKFADELQRRGAYFLVRGGRFEIV